MAKKQSAFFCQECGYKTSQWLGKCPECQQWNSLVEEIIQQKGTTALDNKKIDRPKAIHEIDREKLDRLNSGNDEFDRVVGGGLVPGSLTLIGGEPGVGKSTLLMEVCGKLSKLSKEKKVLYISGEESESQVAARAKRLGVSEENFYIYHESSWQNMAAQIAKFDPSFLVIDSIQTTTSEDIASPPGSVSQIREIAFQALNVAKSHGITTFLIGHVNKDGNVAGPKMLEHMVDTVIYFEGDQNDHYRLLRAVKNRFGNTNEVGIFEMKEEGLKEVANPTQFFLEEIDPNAFGRSISCILEGTRVLMVETQALVVENKFAMGRRTSQGVDSNRVAMLIAVIEKYFGIPLGANDIYVNLAGGLKVKTREIDLAIIAGILSSLRNASIDSKTVFIGEVGLTGEVRSVPKMEQRLKELSHLNYTRVITSKRAVNEFNQKYKFEFIGIHKANELETILF